MNLTAAVLTNLERPDLLAETLEYLALAGLSQLRLIADVERRGQARPFLRALAWLLEESEPRGWILLAEDDIAVPVGFGRYLSTVCERLEPHRARLGFATLYCSAGYRDWVATSPIEGVPSFGRLIPNDCFSGNLCLLFPRESLAALLPVMRAIHDANPDWGGDRVLSRAADYRRLEACCHTPSLVDHRGRYRTTVDSHADNLSAFASDYVGDDWES